MIPKYIQLKEKLSEEIAQKKYPLYSKLPPETDMAKEYGVSRATVRQALSLLAEDGIIDKHWGSGNTVIGSYETSRSSTVAVIIHSLSEPDITGILDDMRYALSREDLSIALFETHGSQAEERAVLEEISKDLYAGCIIYPASRGLPSMNNDLYQRFLIRQQPILFLNATPYGMPDVPSVRGDEYECGYMCARHFINKGHRLIGAVFNCNSGQDIQRFNGFICALRDANIPFSEDRIYWLGPEQPTDDLYEYILRMKGNMSALVCDSISIAETVYDIALRASVSIPGDLAVISCEEASGEGMRGMTFSSAALTKSLGKEAASAFLSIKKDGSVKPAAIGYKLIQGQSS